MSVAQVALRVKAHAQELGDDQYPSRMTVYRLFKPVVVQQSGQQKRPIDWKGTRLSLKTHAGEELAVEWSNQVWQVDHTRADILVVDQREEILGRPWLTLFSAAQAAKKAGCRAWIWCSSCAN